MAHQPCDRHYWATDLLGITTCQVCGRITSSAEAARQNVAVMIPEPAIEEAAGSRESGFPEDVIPMLRHIWAAELEHDLRKLGFDR